MRRVVAPGSGCRTWVYKAARVSSYAVFSLTAVYAIFAGRSIMKETLRRNSVEDFSSRTTSTSVLGATSDAAGDVLAPWEPGGCQTLLFFHVPKTGGESMNGLWWSQGQGRQRKFGWDGYTFLALRRSELQIEEQKRYLVDKTPWLNSNPQRRHQVVEVHCGNAISFMQARETIGTMRENHKLNGCGFFAFTLLRSPLDWLLSLYDDICHRRLKGHMDTCPQKNDMTPSQEMLEYPHRDGTVSYLMHGWKGWDSPGPVEESDVEEIYRSLESYLDLVAFTDDIDNLRRYLTERFAAPKGFLTPEEEDILAQTSVKNANRQKTVNLSDFTEDELKTLNATIQLDWKLFEALADMPRPW